MQQLEQGDLDFGLLFRRKRQPVPKIAQHLFERDRIGTGLAQGFSQARGAQMKQRETARVEKNAAEKDISKHRRVIIVADSLQALDSGKYDTGRKTLYDHASRSIRLA